MKHLLDEYCDYKGKSREIGVTFHKELAASAIGMNENNISEAALQLWTSTALFDGKRELSHIFNESIRRDKKKLLKYVLPIAKVMKVMLTARRGQFPPSGITYRGAVLPREHLWFYKLPGRQYRVPGYLATSFEKETAKFFAERQEALQGHAHPMVLFVVKVDPRGEDNEEYRCWNAGYITKSMGCQDEFEFLFVPYSVFTVEKFEERQRTPDNPYSYIITVNAARDNLPHYVDGKLFRVPTTAPLSPWY